MRSPEGDPRGPLEEQSPEKSYDEMEWEKLKRGGPADAIKKGRIMGVPQEELDRFAEYVIARETESQNYGLVYRFRKNIGIGTEEEVRAAGEQAYKFFLETGDSGSAMSIAEDVYGRDSEEWKRANEDNEAEWKKTEKRRKRKEKEMEDEERELKASIPEDATFAYLFNVIDAIEEKEGLGELHFEEELYDNFDTDVVEKVLDFMDERSDEAMTTKILDFFEEHGYSKKDVSVYLPIKFRKSRKKKKN